MKIDIKANKWQRENLQILLDKVFPIMLAKGLDVSLGRYVSSCGTPMCIAGEACVLPEFVEKGLCFDGVSERVPSFKSYIGPIALDLFFGEPSYNRLFDFNFLSHSDYQEVLNRKKLLEEYLSE